MGLEQADKSYNCVTAIVIVSYKWNYYKNLWFFFSFIKSSVSFDRHSWLLFLL